MSGNHGKRGKRGKRDKRGVALVMVLGAITVLTIFLTELQEETSSQLSAALSERDALKAEYYARSAVNLARLLIAAEPEIRKAIPLLGTKMPQIPVWEFTDMVLGPFNDKMGAEAFNGLVNADPASAKNIGLTGGGHYELKIVDEDSKLNLNPASRSFATSEQVARQLLGIISPVNYNPLFEGRDGDNQFSDRQTICGALVDWIDEDENLYACDPFSSTASATKGAEDNFYQMIGLGYRRKNAPFDSLEELRLVRGVGDDFWSTFVDPDPSDPHKRVMSVWGQGKVNINTANAQTLLSVICSDRGAVDFCNDATQLETFIMGVTLVRSFTMGAPIFQSTNDFVSALQGNGPLGMILKSLQLKPITFKSPQELKKLVSTQSKVFSIYADGVVPGLRRTTKTRIHAVVDFRGAQAIGEAVNGILGQTQPNQPPNGPPGGLNGANNALPTSASPQALAAMAAANPAGNVIYWRIE